MRWVETTGFTVFEYSSIDHPANCKRCSSTQRYSKYSTLDLDTVAGRYRMAEAYRSEACEN